MNTDLLHQLERVEQLATASKLLRLLRAPGRYLYAIGFRLLRYRATKKGVMKQADTFFGTPMTVVLPAGTDIYLTGGKSHDSEIRLARFLIQRLQPNDVFADVGAHFGYFSLLAARLVGPKGQVVAFEASATTHAVLAQNVAASAVVQAHHCAVSDQQETISFYEFPILYNEFNSLDVTQFENEQWFKEFKPTKITVPAVTLDAFFTSSGQVPAVLKIDVEGAELKVIRGAAKLLERAAPAVVLEYLEPKRHNTGHQQAAALLRELGYQSHRIGADGQLIVCPDLDAYLQAEQIDSDNFVFVKA
ncbi:FkbM family methyltransferase [Hymenobacter radiodurans]|uniref:FkbM family methyltransferase n=1 Tax=Hymenobacter radiodurans TaxID=2496028 RepID=UPI001058C077|nr:FkbM family methyltransferase [Hymenobacter radiodurans]